MKMFISMGPIIGGIIIALYLVYLRLSCYLKSLKVPNGQQRVTYHSGLRVYLFADMVSKRDKIIFNVLLAVEALLVLICLIVPRAAGGDYWMDGMVESENNVITDNTSHKKEGYSNVY